MTRRFNGWHMLAIMIGMFGTIIAVNLVMARAAIGTFGGVVVENSYVASQRYNGWLAEARAQKALGWSADVTVDAARHVHIAVAGPEGPLEGATVRASATHPLGLEAESDLTFRAAGAGVYVSTRPASAGRWLLRIEVRQGDRVALYRDEVPA